MSDQERLNLIARGICDSEAFMWLMVGGDPNWRDAHLTALREAWSVYRAAGGGYGGERP